MLLCLIIGSLNHTFTTYNFQENSIGFHGYDSSMASIVVSMVISIKTPSLMLLLLLIWRWYVTWHKGVKDMIGDMTVKCYLYDIINWIFRVILNTEQSRVYACLFNKENKFLNPTS